MTPAVAKPSLAELRFEHFAGREGQTFVFLPGSHPEQVAHLELVTVSQGRHSFSARFRGSRDEGIVSEMCTLMHEDFSECAILLTRILPPGGDANHPYYEAIFA